MYWLREMGRVTTVWIPLRSMSLEMRLPLIKTVNSKPIREITEMAYPAATSVVWRMEK